MTSQNEELLEQYQQHLEASALLLASMFEQMYEMVMDAWAAVQAGMNAGQNTMYEQNIAVAVQDWFMFAASEWPWVESGEYADTVLGAHEAAEQAFGNAINRTAEMMDEKISNAQAVAYVMEMLEWLMSAVPG